MKNLLKNFLLLAKIFSPILKKSFLLGITFLGIYSGQGQIVNFVTNGGFEDKINCNYPNHLNKAIGWMSIGSDSTKLGGSLHAINCYSNAPNTGVGFQYPHSGDTYCRISPYCATCSPINSRLYPKNRLRENLKSNATYCAKMYISRQDACPYAISNLDFLFADSSIDTIKYCQVPLSYLNPQVKNLNTNLVTDTLNWILITGTFVATGNEKYLVIGNFETEAATNSILVDTSFGTGVWAEYFVDDISCIDINLPAFAGRDTAVIIGDSTYIGRESDIGIDEACVWYKLPSTTPIDAIAGFWIKPTETCTYVVQQEICGIRKSDTVIVYMDAVGIEKLKLLTEELKIYPIPAQDFIELRVSQAELFKEINSVAIYDNLGQLLDEQKINFENKSVRISTSDLPNGIYFIRLKSWNSNYVNKRFVISR